MACESPSWMRKGDQTLLFIHGLGSYAKPEKKNIEGLKNGVPLYRDRLLLVMVIPPGRLSVICSMPM